MNYRVTSSQQRSFSPDHLAICIRLFTYNANCVWKRYIHGTLSFIASIEDNSSRKRWGIYFCRRSGHAPLSCAIRIIKDILTFSARRLPSAAIKFFWCLYYPKLIAIFRRKKKWKNVEACKRKPMVLKRCLRSNLISFLKKDFRHLN